MQAVAAHDERTARTDRTGLVDRRDAGDDRPQNKENEDQRRKQRQHHLEPESGVEFSVIVYRRRRFRPDRGKDQDVDHVEADKHQPRHYGAQEHFAGTCRTDVKDARHLQFAGRILEQRLARGSGLIDGAGQLVGQDDQNDRRRDDLPECAGCGDRTGCQLLGIVVAQHGRQRDQTHRDDRGTDDAGGGGEQRAHKHHRYAEATRDRAEQLRHGDQQILGDFRPLQHDAHEDEQRNGDQRIAFRLPVDPSKVGHPGAQPL